MSTEQSHTYVMVERKESDNGDLMVSFRMHFSGKEPHVKVMGIYQEFQYEDRNTVSFFN